MNDLGNLLQMIYDLLSGWFTSFTSHATAVMEKLNLIETDTTSIKNSTSDIKSNTDDIKDNTGAIVTPVQSIKTNTDSIKTDTTTIKNNVSTMTNQLGTISTNVGTASAFTEDVANNTLDIKNRIVTIGSDTTQLRSNSNTITSDVSDIKTALNYYLANTPITENVEGAICNIDTDLTDYLQACNVTIPADLTGFSGITLTKCGKNILNYPDTTKATWAGVDTSLKDFINKLPAGSYNIQFKFKITTLNGSGSSIYGIFFSNSNNAGNINARRTLSTPEADIEYNYSLSFSIAPENEGNFTNAYFYCGRNTPVDTVSFYDLMVSVSSAVEPFEKYKAMTYPILFGTTITDGAEINLLDGIIKVNSTPVSYLSITPIAVRTYKGVNNIYSDVGTTALTYRETLKQYIDKQEA